MKQQHEQTEQAKFNVGEIGDYVERLLAFTDADRIDIGIKIAALRSAADMLTNAVSSKGLAAVLQNMLLPPKR